MLFSLYYAAPLYSPGNNNCQKVREAGIEGNQKKALSCLKKALLFGGTGPQFILDTVRKEGIPDIDERLASVIPASYETLTSVSSAAAPTSSSVGTAVTPEVSGGGPPNMKFG